MLGINFTIPSLCLAKGWEDPWEVTRNQILDLTDLNWLVIGSEISNKLSSAPEVFVQVTIETRPTPETVEQSEQLIKLIN